MATTQSTGAVAAQTKSPGIAGLQDLGKNFIATGIADPFTTGLFVFAASIGLNAIINGINYIKKKKSGKEAISDVFKESGKLGVCCAIGTGVGNMAAGTGLVLMAPFVLPMATGVAVTVLLMNFWDKTTSRTKKSVSAAPFARRKGIRSPRIRLRKMVMALP